MNHWFVHIKFKHDGVDVKLTYAGIAVGTTVAGSLLLALDVKKNHEPRLRRKSPINVFAMAGQILLHAGAYVACPLPFEPCRTVRRHANPVNVSWKELSVPNPAGLALDR